MNWISEWKQWLVDGQITDAPDIYLEASALAILSTIVNRGVFVRFGHRRLYPQMYLILVGKSSLFRKSTCLDLASKFVTAVKPEMILEQAFSSEYFIQSVAEKKRGVIFVDEFITLLDVLKREYSSEVKRLIVELFDREMPWSRGTLGGGQTIISDPFLNIISATTPSWLQEAISEGDIKGGMIPRFVMVLATHKDRIIKFPGQGRSDIEKQLVEELYEISLQNRELYLSDTAKELFTAHVDFLEHETTIKGDIFGAFYARLVSYLLKFATLYHMSNTDNKGCEISGESMTKAIAFAKRVAESQEKTVMNLAWSSYQIKRQQVMEILESAGMRGIMYSNLLRKVTLPTQELMRVLESLSAEETVIMSTRESAGSKPGTWVVLKEYA